jgi:hypothetical protein
MTRARWMPLALAFGLAAVAAGRGDLELAHGVAGGDSPIRSSFSASGGGASS